jgi:DNA processing protein
MSPELRAQAATVALLRVTRRGEHAGLAGEIRTAGGPEAALTARLAPPGTLTCATEVAAGAMREAARLVARWRRAGIRVLTCASPDYPGRLRAVPHHPPLLFARGELGFDARAVAVVGTRRPSPPGLALAADVASCLAGAGVTVVSGLAEGIDTAAHVAALGCGGRTVAVLGTGLCRVYPPRNARLQGTIAARGLLLSQFWPSEPPTRMSFLARNAVMSGYCAATVVIEASRHSGARAQAGMALAQGRQLLLPSALLAREWAREYARLPGVRVVRDPGELLAVVDGLTTPAPVRAP